MKVDTPKDVLISNIQLLEVYLNEDAPLKKAGEYKKMSNDQL